jgi:hypothetical protein
MMKKVLLMAIAGLLMGILTSSALAEPVLPRFGLERGHTAVDVVCGKDEPVGFGHALILGGPGVRFYNPAEADEFSRDVAEAVSEGRVKNYNGSVLEPGKTLFDRGDGVLADTESGDATAAFETTIVGDAVKISAFVTCDSFDESAFFSVDEAAMIADGAFLTEDGVWTDG